jgi:anti-anti-sigma factor
MTFGAATRKVGEVTVVDLTGQLSFHEAGALRALLLDLLEKGQKNFLLNLQDLKHLDSSGIAELARAYISVRNREGDLKVVNLAPHISEILRIVGLHTILQDFEDESTALGSFR